MRCSVVFGVTLRLLVINISSSSPTINIAAYYLLCVITFETVAVVDWDAVDNTWHVAALTAGIKARYRLRMATSAYPKIWFSTYWQYHQCISTFYASCNVNARK